MSRRSKMERAKRAQMVGLAREALKVFSASDYEIEQAIENFCQWDLENFNIARDFGFEPLADYLFEERSQCKPAVQTPLVEAEPGKATTSYAPRARAGHAGMQPPPVLPLTHKRHSYEPAFPRGKNRHEVPSAKRHKLDARTGSQASFHGEAVDDDGLSMEGRASLGPEIIPSYSPAPLPGVAKGSKPTLEGARQNASLRPRTPGGSPIHGPETPKSVMWRNRARRMELGHKHDEELQELDGQWGGDATPNGRESQKEEHKAGRAGSSKKGPDLGNIEKGSPSEGRSVLRWDSAGHGFHGHTVDRILEPSAPPITLMHQRRGEGCKGGFGAAGALKGRPETDEVKDSDVNAGQERTNEEFREVAVRVAQEIGGGKADLQEQKDKMVEVQTRGLAQVQADPPQVKNESLGEECKGGKEPSDIRQSPEAVSSVKTEPQKEWTPMAVSDAEKKKATQEEDVSLEKTRTLECTYLKRKAAPDMFSESRKIVAEIFSCIMKKEEGGRYWNPRKRPASMDEPPQSAAILSGLMTAVKEEGRGDVAGPDAEEARLADPEPIPAQALLAQAAEDADIPRETEPRGSHAERSMRHELPAGASAASEAEGDHAAAVLTDHTPTPRGPVRPASDARAATSADATEALGGLQERLLKPSGAEHADASLPAEQPHRANVQWLKAPISGAPCLDSKRCAVKPPETFKNSSGGLMICSGRGQPLVLGPHSGGPQFLRPQMLGPPHTLNMGCFASRPQHMPWGPMAPYAAGGTGRPVMSVGYNGEIPSGTPGGSMSQQDHSCIHPQSGGMAAMGDPSMVQYSLNVHAGDVNVFFGKDRGRRLVPREWETAPPKRSSYAGGKVPRRVVSAPPGSSQAERIMKQRARRWPGAQGAEASEASSETGQQQQQQRAMERGARMVGMPRLGAAREEEAAVEAGAVNGEEGAATGPAVAAEQESSEEKHGNEDPLEEWPANGEADDGEPRRPTPASDDISHTPYDVGVPDQPVPHSPKDLSKGQERVAIPWLNERSEEMPPASFMYMRDNEVFEKAHVRRVLSIISEDDCCRGCVGDCLAGPPCPCNSYSLGAFAYTTRGLLRAPFLLRCLQEKTGKQDPSLLDDRRTELGRGRQKGVQQLESAVARCPPGKACPVEVAKNADSPRPCAGHQLRSFIKECYKKCGCSMKCGNRVVQRGLTRRLQVFMTEHKGWGVRPLEDLPKGAFVAELAGEVITNTELHQRNVERQRLQATAAGSLQFRHTFPCLLDADWQTEQILDDNSALCIDTTNYGNVARFINHRCGDANLIDIPVEIETPDRHYYHVALFTRKAVKTGEELTWDYGIDFDDDSHPIQAFDCQCSSQWCRGGGGSRPKPSM